MQSDFDFSCRACDMFFIDNMPPSCHSLLIENKTAQHITRSLRKRTGDIIGLINGQGLLYYGKITAINPKSVQLAILHQTQVPPRPLPALAVGALKNTDRIEWLVEKATEIGVSKIYILQSDRTLKKYAAKTERLRHIMRAALLQSQQAYLPELWVDIPFSTLLKQYFTQPACIAHCHPKLPKTPLSELPAFSAPPLILIGPEGDFSEREIQQATLASAHSLHLCAQRLRTETAALYALSFFQQNFSAK